MKTLIKVFIWLSMIFMFWLIFPLVVGIFALKKLNEAKTRDELVTMAVVTLLFCNFIAGVLMLVISDEELARP